MKLLILLVCFIAVNGASDYEQWQNFKVKFSKSHTLAEDEFRFEIFQNNLRKIDKHNARYEKGEVSYFLKVTEFADWTAEEFQVILGAESITDVNVETIGTFKRDLNFTRPNTIDWRKENVVTAVKNQLNCGSCYAFSSTGALEGQLAIHRNQLISLSEQELISCADNNGCIGGTTEISFRYVRHHGLSSEEQYPYAEIKNDCRSDLSDKPITTIQGYIRVNQNEEEMADAVASVGPISIDLRATEDWGLYGGGVYDNPSCDGLYPNHAVLIVGYDSEAWILKNSWGANWGEDGYMRLVSGKNKCSITNFPCYPVL